VSFVTKQKRHKGYLAGVVSYPGQTLLRVQLTSGDKLAYLVSEQQSGGVEVNDWEGELPCREKGRKIVRRAGYLEAVFCGNEPRDFTTQSRLETLILGSISTLHAEVVDTTIAAPIPDNGRLVSGSFQDILRVKRFSPGQAFRNEIVSDMSADPETILRDESAITIFDSPRGFLKTREKLRSSDWVVVLDRTAAGFEDAVNALNQEYLRLKQTDLASLSQETGIPWGVEVMAFEEATS
jgi:hypothetical protein